MKKTIIRLLEDKGFKIPENDYNELTEFWNSIQLQKEGFDHSYLKESDIAISSIAGVDYID